MRGEIKEPGPADGPEEGPWVDPSRDRDRLRAAMRADGLRALDRLRIVPVVSNLLGSILAWSHLGATASPAVTAWLCVMLALVVIDILLGPNLSGRRSADSDAERDYRHTVLKSLGYGTLWGVLVTLFYGAADHEARHFIAILITAYLCSSALVLAAVPAAVLAFSVPIVSQATLVLLAEPTEEHVFLLQLIGVYVIVIPLVLRQMSRASRERIEALESVSEHKQMLSVLLDDFQASTSEWMWQTDDQLRFQRVSEGLRKELSGAPGPHIGQTFGQLADSIFTFDGVVDPQAERVHAALRAREPFRDAVIKVSTPEGIAWWSASGSPTWARDGRFAGYRGICRDVTEKRRAELELTFLAHNDPLTGGANRASFNRELDRIGEAVQDRGGRFALILFDLDDFKAVNDTAGHAIGDEVLAQAFRRMSALLPAGSFMARIGGDEFAAILELSAHTAPGEVKQQVEGMVAAVSRPIEASTGIFRIGASAGVAILPDNGSDRRVAMQLADIALYNAKDDDTNRVHLASEAEGAAYSYRKVLERDLRSAVDRGELSLFFQPVVAAETGNAIAMEALMRWRHPRYGFVSPGVFIPIAEQTGSIQQIGRWALAEACKQASTWPSTVKVAVNISPRQLDRDDLGAYVLEALKAAGLPASRLEVEITESAFLGGVERVQKTVRRLQAYGVTVAMDDFGTGYSSLSSLQDVPFDKLKIDQSLVARDRQERRAVSILKSIVAIGRALDLHVTAEGVETAEQAAFLKGLGCNSLQGYLFARPMPAEDLPAYFAKETARQMGAPRHGPHSDPRSGQAA
jgi:diguanylate cyclase (GGDEF)-like protein